MNIIVYLVMFGWIPIVILLFKKFPAQQAVIIGFIVAWLFLPQAKFSISGLPDYTKISATCYGVLLASFIYDNGRLNSFRFSLLDIPMLIWCICPIFSSLSNGLGLYDGLSSTLSQTMAWGIPYFLGRIYLNNITGLRNLAFGIFLGGLVYIPLCLIEIRMSPQLHRIVYGYHAHSFAQTIRAGGFRPTVFMQHGLEVGMWMMAATLIGIWLWKTNCIKQIYGIATKWLVVALLITFILVKSTGAYLLLFLGIVVFFIVWYFRTSITVLLIIASINFYLSQNIIIPEHFASQFIVSLEKVFPQERIQSLQYRIDNEILLKEKAQQKMIFGWGGWGRNRVYDYNWEGELVDISTTDSLWIIAFGINGILGLVSLFLAFFVPIIHFIRMYPGNTWCHPKLAPIAALVVVLTLYMIDCLLNFMINPIFILACGGVAGLTVERPNLKIKKDKNPRKKMASISASK